VQAAVNGCISKEENPDPIGEDSLAVGGTQTQKNKFEYRDIIMYMDYGSSDVIFSWFSDSMVVRCGTV
jgi:hypothetical protein